MPFTSIHLVHTDWSEHYWPRGYKTLVHSQTQNKAK